MAIGSQMDIGASGSATTGVPTTGLKDYGLEKYLARGFKMYTVNMGGKNILRVENKSGQVVKNIEGFDAEGMQTYLADLFRNSESMDGVVGIDADGNLYVDGGPGGASKEPPADVTPAPGTGKDAGTTNRFPTPSPTPTPGTGTTGGNAAGATGGAARGGVTNPFAGGGGSGVDSGGTAVPPIGGADESNAIDPNAPLGVNDPGRMALTGDPFKAPGSLFDMLPENPTLADVIGAVTRRQEAGLEGQLGALGQVYQESLDDPNSQALRSRIGDLLEDPYTYDEETIRRMQGAQNQAIGNRADVLAQQQRQQAASMGTGRSQGELAAQATQRAAAGSQAAAENQIRMRAAEQNQQDLRSALAQGGASIQQDRGTRERMAGQAADAMGSSQVFGDAFLTNALIAPQTGVYAQTPVRFEDMRMG